MGQEWTALWIYFTAPLLGMLAAGELYLRSRGIQRVFCAKLHHHNSTRCIFRCRYAELMSSADHIQGDTCLQTSGTT